MEALLPQSFQNIHISTRALPVDLDIQRGSNLDCSGTKCDDSRLLLIFFFFFVRPTELNGMLGVSSHLDKTLACICTFSLPCNLWAAYYQSCQLPALCHVFRLNGNKTKFVLWWQPLRVWATCDVMTLADTVSVGISAFNGGSRTTHVWLIQLLLGKFTLCHLSYHCKPLLK